MPQWKEGDRVRVVARKVTEDDRKTSRYFEHMAGLVGDVQNVYADGIALKVDLDSLSDTARGVHAAATDRMRKRFTNELSEDARKQLTKEEMEFVPHYVVLVQPADLEAA